MTKKLKTLSPLQYGRRERALTRLEAQLKSGVKTTNEGVIALTDSDKKRIKSEIEILNIKLHGKKENQKDI
jgi:hypothetical protein